MKQSQIRRIPSPAVEPQAPDPVTCPQLLLNFVQVPFNFEFPVQEGDEPCEQS